MRLSRRQYSSGIIFTAKMQRGHYFWLRSMEKVEKSCLLYTSAIKADDSELYESSDELLSETALYYAQI